MTGVPNSDADVGGLDRVFHEPHRLGIMSALCAADGDGLAFNQIKRECGLTDGNLSRHLRTLEDAGAVRIEKTFVSHRPRTTVFITDEGRESFMRYLRQLEDVLRRALESAGAVAEDVHHGATFPLRSDVSASGRV